VQDRFHLPHAFHLALAHDRRRQVTVPPTEDRPDAGRPGLARTPRADTPSDDDRVPLGRIVGWVAVGVLVVIGLVLYFIYSRRLSPLIG
jgi:hypothetical protein